MQVRSNYHLPAANRLSVLFWPTSPGKLSLLGFEISILQNKCSWYLRLFWLWFWFICWNFSPAWSITNFFSNEIFAIRQFCSLKSAIYCDIPKFWFIVPVNISFWFALQLNGSKAFGHPVVFRMWVFTTTDRKIIYLLKKSHRDENVFRRKGCEFFSENVVLGFS